MIITAEQSAARVRASLGRSPQDALESTVVLEAFGGLGSRTALRLSADTVDTSSPPPLSVATRRPLGQVTQASGREVLGLVATLLATTAWVSPLTDALGGAATDRAWKLALPVSLFLQWMLRRRHLNGPHGLGLLRADGPVLIVFAVSVVVVTGGLLVAPTVALPAALVLTWVGGLLVVVRGWGVPYALCLFIAIYALQLGVPVRVDIVLVIVLTAGALLAALVSTPVPTGRPTPWPRSLAAAAVGGTSGLLIVLDPSVEWSSSRPFPVLALVPSLLASVWAGGHLNRIWTVLLGALASTSLLQRTARTSSVVFAAIVLGAVTRLIVGTALLSGVALLLMPSDIREPLLRLLIGLGAFGLVNFLAAMLESFSRVRSALLVAVTALLAAIASLRLPIDVVQDVDPLVMAALVAMVTAVLPVVRLVHQPDRTMATMF